MDFEVKYYATPGTGQTHAIDLGGFVFGDGFDTKNGAPITTDVNMVGTTGPVSHPKLIQGTAKPGYPKGYALDSRPFITNFALQNNGYADVKFSLPVKTGIVI